MIDLKKFRKENKLSQKDVAEFLGVSRSFIGQVEAGFSKLPASKESKLANNTNNWKVEVATNNLDDNTISCDVIEQNGGNGNIGKITGDCAELLFLRKENDMLRKQLEDLTRTNEKYWDAIVDLMKK